MCFGRTFLFFLLIILLNLLWDSINNFCGIGIKSFKVFRHITLGSTPCCTYFFFQCLWFFTLSTFWLQPLFVFRFASLLVFLFGFYARRWLNASLLWFALLGRLILPWPPGNGIPWPLSWPLQDTPARFLGRDRRQTETEAETETGAALVRTSCYKATNRVCE